MKEKKYKYVIDQDALMEFCMGGEITQHQLDEVNKVITVVLIRHYSNYANNQDLRQWAIAYIIENRSKYDPSFSAYNFVYTGVRNEIGNKIKKYNKEVFTDDYAVFDNRSYDVDPEELPVEVRKFAQYLLGQKYFTAVRIPVDDVLPLMLFLQVGAGVRKLPEVPDFVMDNENAVQIMYKLLRDYIRGDKNIEKESDYGKE